MYGGMNGVGPFGWLIGLVIALLVIAGIVVLIVLLLRSGAPGAPPWPGRYDHRAHRHGPTAREILDERYARGEIEHDEYIRRRDELGRAQG